MAYSGKGSSNSTSQLNTVAWTPKAPTVKPTMSGEMNGLSIKGQDLPQRTSSSNAQDEKLYENRPDAPTKRTY
jgi:hypothetical protein